MTNKKAQILGLPFQMIFSIILIAVFIYVAFIGIKALMSNADSLKLANFVTDFKADLEKSIATTETSVTKTYDIPSFVTSLCFSPNPAAMKADSSHPELDIKKYPAYGALKQGNYVFFYPPSSMQKISLSAYAKVDCQMSCLNITTTQGNPYCINNTKGTVRITISKQIGQPYVTIR